MTSVPNHTADPVSPNRGGSSTLGKERSLMKSFIPQGKNQGKARREVRKMLNERYQEEIARSGFWQEILIRLKIEREISAEMKRRFPPQALYANLARR